MNHFTPKRARKILFVVGDDNVGLTLSERRKFFDPQPQHITKWRGITVEPHAIIFVHDAAEKIHQARAALRDVLIQIFCSAFIDQMQMRR